MPRTQSPLTGLRLPVLLSGCAALLAELAWSRAWVRVLGSTLAATSTVLAVFMLGLGLGALASGPLSRRLDLRGRELYQRLELTLAALLLLSPLLLALADRVMLRWLADVPYGAPATFVLRGLLPLLLLTPATFLMGASLPAMAQELDDEPDPEPHVGALYAWNTAGAVLGTLLASTWLLEALGLRATCFLAGGLSGTAALLAMGRTLAPLAPLPARGEQRAAWRFLPVYAFVGFWALALEVLYGRAVLAASGTTAQSLGAVLACFLGGSALGAWGAGRFLPAADHPAQSLARRLAVLGLVIPLTGLALVDHAPLYLRLYPLFPGSVAGLGATLGLCAALLLLPGILLGSLFPAITRALTPLGGAGRAVGLALAVNSLAGAVGALAAYTWILPSCGLAGGIGAAGGACLLAASYLLFRERAGSGIEAAVFLLLAELVPLALALQPVRLVETAWRLVREVTPEQLASGVSLVPPEVVWYRDGPEASVALTTSSDAGLTLRINGKPDASTEADVTVQAALGHVPMLLFGRPETRMLVIGLGSGQTADAALRYPLERLDVAEISRTVAEAAGAGFRETFPRPFQDPRCHIQLVDGLTMVRAWPQAVDLIVSQPTDLHVQGVGELYTREFYRACRARLREGGRLVQWLPSYELDDVALKTVLRSALREFPEVSLWWFQDLLLIAGEGATPPDLAALHRELDKPGVRPALDEAHLPSEPDTLLARQLADTALLESFAGPGVAATLDRPLVEFQAARARFETPADWAPRLATRLRAHPLQGRLVTDRGLLYPEDTGGALLPTSRLHMNRDLAALTARAYLLHAPVAPDATLVGAEQLFGTYTIWEGAMAGGRIRLTSYPKSLLPDPHVKHAAKASKGPPVLGGEATLSGRPALFGLYRGAPFAGGDDGVGEPRWEGLFTFDCPAMQRTHVLEVEYPAKKASDKVLLGIAADLACLEAGPGGEPVWRHGLVRGGD